MIPLNGMKPKLLDPRAIQTAPHAETPMSQQPLRTLGLLALTLVLCVKAATAEDRFEAAHALYKERV